MPNRKWTDEQRQRQRELIRNWQPWKKSTGCKTPEGKATVSQNALKHGGYTQEMHLIRRYICHANAVIRQINELERQND